MQHISQNGRTIAHIKMAATQLTERKQLPSLYLRVLLTIYVLVIYCLYILTIRYGDDRRQNLTDYEVGFNYNICITALSQSNSFFNLLTEKQSHPTIQLYINLYIIFYKYSHVCTNYFLFNLGPCSGTRIAVTIDVLIVKFNIIVLRFRIYISYLTYR